MKATAFRLCPWILLLLLAACPAAAEKQKRFAGTLNGAPYRIQIPEPWNGGLVLYAHGYLPAKNTWSPLASSFAEQFLKRGFALAESGYSRQGWAVEEALRELDALRLHFEQKFGKPGAVYLTGHSMGAFISLALLEQHPEAYDGALPLCGPLVPALCFYKDPVLDLLAVFEALFGEALPGRYKRLAEAPLIDPGTVEAALQSDPALADRFALHFGIRREHLSSMVAFYQLLIREISDRAGGLPVGNLSTQYAGPGPVLDLNQAAPRYRADPKAQDYLRRFYTPTGAVQDPVLAIHTSYDPLVPPRLSNSFETIAALAGRGEFFVQLFVEAEGHCSIEPALAGLAFDKLKIWVETGERPEPGLLTAP